MSDQQNIPNGPDMPHPNNTMKPQEIEDQNSPIKIPKSVCFADSKGQQLVNIKNFVPSTEFLCELSNDDFGKTILNSLENGFNNSYENSKWISCFKGFEPNSPNHIWNVWEKNVVLEYLYIKGAQISEACQILEGGIRVANIAFEKRVWVKATYNNWATYFEVDAHFKSHDTSSNTDLFIVNFPLKKDASAHTRTMEFVLAFQIQDQIYWDNNNSINYRVYLI